MRSTWASPWTLVLLRLAQADVDDAAHRAAVLRAEVAGIEVDLLEHLGGDDRGEAAEVVDERDRRAVDEDCVSCGRRAAHDEEPGERRRARDAGQVLERAQRVAVGAGDAIDLALLERALDHLARRLHAPDLDGLDVLLARRRPGGSAAARGARRSTIVARSAGLQRLVGLVAHPAGRGHRHVVRARRAGPRSSRSRPRRSWWCARRAGGVARDDDRARAPGDRRRGRRRRARRAPRGAA